MCEIFGNFAGFLILRRCGGWSRCPNAAKLMPWGVGDLRFARRTAILPNLTTILFCGESGEEVLN